jgi:DNA-binding transcriptional LysR family regulator
MEIQQLKHLRAAVQHGNLVKAAEASNITQSGLSRSITSNSAWACRYCTGPPRA